MQFRDNSWVMSAPLEQPKLSVTIQVDGPAYTDMGLRGPVLSRKADKQHQMSPTADSGAQVFCVNRKSLVLLGLRESVSCYK